LNEFIERQEIHPVLTAPARSTATPAPCRDGCIGKIVLTL